MPFQVGEVVRCINTGANPLTRGSLYVVLEPNEEQAGWVTVRSDRGSPLPFLDSRFRIATDPEGADMPRFNEGDYVTPVSWSPLTTVTQGLAYRVRRGGNSIDGSLMQLEHSSRGYSTEWFTRAHPSVPRYDGTTFTPSFVPGDVVEITADRADGVPVVRGDIFVVDSWDGHYARMTGQNRHNREGWGFQARNIRKVEPNVEFYAGLNPFRVGDWAILADKSDETPLRVTGIGPTGVYVRVNDKQVGLPYDDYVKIECPYAVLPGDMVTFHDSYDQWEVESVDGDDIYLQMASNPAIALDGPVTIEDLTVMPRPEPPKPPCYYANTDSAPQPGDIIRRGHVQAVLFRGSPTQRSESAPNATIWFTEITARGVGSSGRITETDYMFSFGQPDIMLVVRDGVPFQIAGI